LSGIGPAASLVTLTPPLRASTPDAAPLKVVLLLALGEKRHHHALALLARATRLASAALIDDLWRARSARELVRTLQLSRI
jgi:hypothetical protein